MSALRSRDRLELGAAFGTAVVHVLPLERWYPEVVEIVAIVTAWVVYLGYLVVADRPRLREMGFRRERLRASAAAALGCFALATGAMAAWGFTAGTLRLHPHMLVLALLYPFWGLIQQWLMLGIVARQLDRWWGRSRAWLTVAITAAVFGVLHAPEVRLVAATFLLGLALTPIYLRWRNLWPLGVVHGWLAIPMYFWMLDVDPWSVVNGAAP